MIEYDAAADNGFCVVCGTVVEENTIVNEVRDTRYCLAQLQLISPPQLTFGETSTGAAIIQGSLVAQGASTYYMHAFNEETDPCFYP